MPRHLAFLVAALLVCANLAAQMVTPELPVSDVPVPDPNTSCSVVSGATKAYAICSTWGGGQYRMQLAADGKPILATREPFDFVHGSRVAVGDDLFYADRGATSISVRRLGSDAEARIDGASSQAGLLWNRGSLLLVIYASGDAWMGAIVDTALRVVVRPFATFPAGAQITAWASAGDGFMLVSRDAANVTSSVIVAPDGTMHPVSLPTPRAYAITDTLASNGSEYFYVWQRRGGPLIGQRYSPAGDAVGDSETIVENASGRVDLTYVVWSGSAYVIVWDDAGHYWMRSLGGAPEALGLDPPYMTVGPAGVFLTRQRFAPETIRRFDTNGPEYVLSYGMSFQTLPAITTDGVETAAVWNDGNDVRIGRIAADGAQLDSTGVVLPIDHTSAVLPAIAADGASSLVVWISGSRINGVFFGRDGVAGKPFVIAEEKLLPGIVVPGVTWDGTQYLVTWSRINGVGSGAVVTPSGSVTPFTYAINVGAATSVSAGPRTLVVYANYPDAKVSGVFLDAAGSPFDIATDVNQSFGLWRVFTRPRVVSNGRDFLITWVLQTGLHHSEAWIARLDDRGHLVGEPFAVASSDGSIDAASAIPLFDGGDYRLVVGGGSPTALFAARITDTTFACGCLEDRLPIPIDFDIDAQGRGLVAGAGHGTVVVGYERHFTNDPVYGSVPRVMLRFARMPRRRGAAR